MMKRKLISRDVVQGELRDAVSVLKEGGIIVYPTDTVYGLAVDAFNLEAIGKLFVLKKRSQKPLPVIVANMAMAKSIAEISHEQETIMKKYWPGAVTFVVKKKNIVPNALTLGLDTVGIRIPKSDVSVYLAKLLGNPITSTSANISGNKVCTTVDEVLREFSDFESQPDYLLDIGELKELPPSTVVDLTVKPPKVLREGPVKFLR